MPRERKSLTHKFSLGGHEGYITAGMYEDGTVGKIFLTDIGKEGSTLRGMMNSFATAISIALQYGVPLETLVRKFAYMRFEPEGITTNPEIPFAKSMPDYIMRWLASRFLDADTQEELGILTPEVRAKKTAEDVATGASEPAGPANGTANGGSSRRRGARRRSRPRRAHRHAAGRPGPHGRPRPRPGVQPVRRHDAAHRLVLHVPELRQQHRLRLSGVEGQALATAGAPRCRDRVQSAPARSRACGESPRQPHRDELLARRPTIPVWAQGVAAAALGARRGSAGWPGVRVLVTGGAGFVGANLALALAPATPTGHRRARQPQAARLRAQPAAPARRPASRFVHGDVREPRRPARRSARVDAIVECSAEPSVLAGRRRRARLRRADEPRRRLPLPRARAPRRGAARVPLDQPRLSRRGARARCAFDEAETRFELAASSRCRALAAGIAEDFPLEGARTLYGATKLAAELLVDGVRARRSACAP